MFRKQHVALSGFVLPSGVCLKMVHKWLTWHTSDHSLQQQGRLWVIRCLLSMFAIYEAGLGPLRHRWWSNNSTEFNTLAACSLGNPVDITRECSLSNHNRIVEINIWLSTSDPITDTSRACVTRSSRAWSGIRKHELFDLLMLIPVWRFYLPCRPQLCNFKMILLIKELTILVET